MKPNLAEDIISLSDFRKKSAGYIQEIRSRGRPLVLTQNGHSAAILMSPEAFERFQYERDLFAAVARGEKELAQGEGIPHEQVFGELRRRLK